MTLKLKYMDPSKLVAHARNSRTHSPGQVAKIVAALREFGFINPVIVAGTTIIAGHARVEAVLQVPEIKTVPTLDVSHLTEAQQRAYIIADNRLSEDAGWNDAILREELGFLNGLDFSVSLTGFDDADLRRLGQGYNYGLASDVLSSLREDAPEDGGGEASQEIENDLGVALGDVWVMGNHRLMCGDSTSREDVERLLSGAKPLLMVTDPPYGVEYDPSWRNQAGAANTKRIGKVLNDDRADWREAWELFTGDVAYVWHAGVFSPVVAESMHAVGFESRALIIWAKPKFAMGRGDYHHKHEPCWYMVRKGQKSNWRGDRKQTTLWEIPYGGQDTETTHGTQKPLECMARPILNHTDKGDAVYEPFSGSGTTLIAAEQLGRVCYGMELNPSYVSMAVRRWEKLTGKVAVKEAAHPAPKGRTRVRTPA